jgi:hypothetical protein
MRQYGGKRGQGRGKREEVAEGTGGTKGTGKILQREWAFFVI